MLLVGVVLLPLLVMLQHLHSAKHIQAAPVLWLLLL